MKASEMTNEELANALDNVTVNELQAFADFDRQIEALREASERLRKLGALERAVKVAGETSESFATDNAALLAKLKVAEDALKEMLDFQCLNCPKLSDPDCRCAWSPKIHKWRAALAAIREKGGAK